jgi:hypothetical protein
MCFQEGEILTLLPEYDPWEISYSNQKKIANNLVRVIETRRFTTAGYWVDWIQRVEHLPLRLQQCVWKRVTQILPADTVRYLKTWRNNGRC